MYYLIFSNYTAFGPYKADIMFGLTFNHDEKTMEFRDIETKKRTKIDIEEIDHIELQRPF